MNRLLIFIIFLVINNVHGTVEKQNNVVFFDNMTLEEFEIKIYK